MAKNILLTIFITAVLGFSIAAIADDSSADQETDASDELPAPTKPKPESGKSGSVQSQESSSVGTEVILSDFELGKPKQGAAGEQVLLYGPYSFHSLPADVQEKIIKGFDSSGQPSAASLVRKQMEEQNPARDKEINISVQFQQSRSDVDRLVRAVRDNNVGGWNVNVKRRNGGVMLYLKKKFN